MSINTEKKHNSKKSIRRKKVTKKRKSFIKEAIINIKTTKNNTIISICDINDNALLWTSAGHVTFKGARKRTLFAIQAVLNKSILQARSLRIRSVSLKIGGLGYVREASLKAFENANIRFTSIADVTAIAHNGCRPRKRRKV